MRRFELSNEQFSRIEHLLPGKPGDLGFTAKDNRLFIDAVLWIARTGAPWRDLPPRFGHFNSVFQRFRRWCEKGTWKTILSALQDPDLEWLFIDSTIIRAHQHSAGAENSSAEAEAIGTSRGGKTTKIHIAVDALGNPVCATLSPGNESDIIHAEELIGELQPEVLIADKGYDSDALVSSLKERGIEVVIPPRSNRVDPREYDKHLYRLRSLVECLINQLKQLRRVATRYEKRASSFLGMVLLGAIMITLK